MSKNIISREEFKSKLQNHASEMATDYELRKDALDVLTRADQHRWIHQTTWFGEPILNIPHDIFALQEIIFKTRPEYIIEIGVAWGGSLLYSTLMDVLGGKKIIGVDIFVPEDLVQRIGAFGRLSDRIDWIVGSSD